MAYDFDVTPLGGYGPRVMSGLSEGFQRARVEREERQRVEAATEKENAKMLEIMDAVKSRDPDKLAEAMIKYPDAQSRITAAQGVMSAPAKEIEKDIYRRVLSNPDTALQSFEQGIAQMKEASADQRMISGVLQDMDGLASGDARGMENIKLKVAAEDPQAWKAYSDQQKAKNKELFKGQDDTSAMQDYKYYQKLKKSDPVAAEEFGKERGYVSREGDELSSHLQKRLSMANDEAVSSESNSRSYEDLAAQVSESNMGAGLFGGTWKEKFKDIAGTQDAVTDLRKKYNAIRASQATKNLPPGPASDKDIALALSGFPSDNANKETIASFMRGMAKLEAQRARFANFKASYISEEGTERGMLDSWKAQNEAAQPEAETGGIKFLGFE